MRPLKLQPHVSAEEYLQILELYLVHQNISRVSQEVNCGRNTVGKRLQDLGVVLRSPSRSRLSVQDLNPPEKIDSIRTQLKDLAGRPLSRKRSSPLTAAERLQTLDLYLQFQNSNQVGKKLGVRGEAIRQRLKVMGVQLRPRGQHSIQLEQVNEPEFLAGLRSRLQDEVAQEERAAAQP